jgi:hypothetical protein
VPEALARTDHAFTIRQDTRPARRRTPAAGPSRLALLALLRRHRGRAAGLVLTGALMAGVAVNALLLQDGFHPAPLFKPTLPQAAQGPRSDLRDSVWEPTQARGLPPILPPQRPAQLTGTPEAARPVPLPAPKVERPAVATLPAPAPRDTIGEVLRTGAVGEPSRSVLAAQKALQKLGYGPIKADGVFGSGTKQAVERFERDRKLPVTGDLSGRTGKELLAIAAQMPQ